MPARPARTRVLAAALTALAALLLAACDDGEGLRDEGPSSAGTHTSSSAGTQRATSASAGPHAPSATAASARPPSPSR
ncbi:hypothetical protein ACYF6T_31615 [Streptomyces sp. 7R007]